MNSAAAGTWAWQRAVTLASRAERQHAATVRRERLRLAIGALAFSYVGWSTLAAGWQLHRLRSSAAGDVVLAGFVLASLLCGKVVVRTVTRLRAAVTAKRACAATLTTTLPAAAEDRRVGDRSLAADVSYWVQRAVAGYRAASVLEQYAPGLTWWHDVRLVADPAVVFDHVGFGAVGVVTVEHIVTADPWALTIDPSAGLICAGMPISGFGQVNFLGLQLRAASSIARAAGLPMTRVTSIAVVHNAPLVDTWGAPTVIERLDHRNRLPPLTYCVPEQLPAALMFDGEIDADTAVFAVHQLADGLHPAGNEHHPIRPAPRRKRRDEFPHPAMNR